MYYLGLKKNTVKNSNFFEKLILLKGDDEFSYEHMFGKDIDYNAMANFNEISRYFTICIEKVKAKDKNAKFMLYNQAAVEFMNDTSDIVCLNDVELIRLLNNKPRCRELVSDVANILDYKFLKAGEISLAKLDKLFGQKNGKYVVQQPIGFGGEGTFLLEGDIALPLEKGITYSVSKYVENPLNINNTFMISDNDILIFEGSIQIVKVEDQLRYDGFDYEGYKNLDKSMLKKVFETTKEIAKKLQSMGYRGVGGIDYIISGKKLFFMEINPRFQVSSQEIDRRLVESGLPSIFELNYLSFYDKKKFGELVKKIQK